MVLPQVALWCAARCATRDDRKLCLARASLVTGLVALGHIEPAAHLYMGYLLVDTAVAAPSTLSMWAHHVLFLWVCAALWADPVAPLATLLLRQEASSVLLNAYLLLPRGGRARAACLVAFAAAFAHVRVHGGALAAREACASAHAACPPVAAAWVLNLFWFAHVVRKVATEIFQVPVATPNP
jgi:hypothetical protein